MKKFTVLLVMVFLTLMVGSVTYAQEGNPFDDGDGRAPTTVDSFSISPGTAAIGSSVTFQGNYSVPTPGTTQVALCFYFATADEPAWDTNFAALGSVAGVPFSKYTGADPCPAAGPYQSIAFYATDTTNASFGDTFTQAVVVPAVATGTKNIVARYYEGTGCNNTVAPGTGTCSNGGNYIIANLTVDPAETPDTGLSGRIIDSKTLQPWLYGAEIKVVQTNGANTGWKGTTYVSTADGTWSVTFPPAGTDGLVLCAANGGCTAGNEYASYQVYVNFTCDLEVAVGTRVNIADNSQPVECPTAGLTGVPVNYEVTVTDSATGSSVNVGDWETSRGPTAVTLQNISTGSNSTVALTIGFVVVMLAGVTFVMFRRRETA